MMQQRRSVDESQKVHHLGVVTQHPIQYHSPLYRRYNESDRIEVTVFYCCRRGIESYEAEKLGGAEVEWDIPLLEGYESVFLENMSPKTPVEDGFFSLINPSIIRQLLEHDLDALSVHGHNFATYHIAILATRILGIPVFTSSDTHLGLERPLLKRLLRKPLLSLFYKNFEAFLAIGEMNREFYKAHGVDEEEIFHVPYTVDNDFFQQRTLEASEIPEFKRRERLHVERPVVLYVSKLMERKRPGDLLEAYRRLRDRGGDAQLVFVGDGHQRALMERRADRSDYADDIHFMGFRNQSELPQWYSIGDVFVLPSENEPWGVVVNEVMNAGTPVISTTDVGSAHDLVEPGQTGYLYEPGDVAALTGHLERILEDEQLRKKMGRNCLERIDNWSYDQAVEGMERALDAVAQDRPLRRRLVEKLRQWL